MFEVRGEDLGVGWRIGLVHRLEIFVELIHVGDAGNGGGHAGLVHDPFERSEKRAGLGKLLCEGTAGFNAAEPAGHDLHGHDAKAGLSGGVKGLVHGGIHGEVVSGENDVEDALLDHPWNELRLAAVGADAGEAHFALLFGILLHFKHVVSDVGGATLAVEIPDVDVIGVELVQALVEILEHARFIGRVRLRRKDDLLALSAEGRAHHALIVAVLVAAGSVEVVDAEVGGALDDAGVGGDHAAETDRGDLEAGAAEGLIGELDRGAGRSSVLERDLTPRWRGMRRQREQAGRRKGRPKQNCDGRFWTA